MNGKVLDFLLHYSQYFNVIVFDNQNSAPIIGIKFVGKSIALYLLSNFTFTALQIGRAYVKAFLDTSKEFGFKE